MGVQHIIGFITLISVSNCIKVKGVYIDLCDKNKLGKFES
jgi:hypothetical protein